MLAGQLTRTAWCHLLFAFFVNVVHFVSARNSRSPGLQLWLSGQRSQTQPAPGLLACVHVQDTHLLVEWL